ncbi:MAG: DNA polymerase IV [Smithella sp.]|nr:DNA polymerase IV [Smithella sp.]HOU49818.1 DNA polymerase IV [Smithella sp.]HQG64912.1 DNA polymerase IV [Smithella sp.]HQH15847.1 DNA polymerase IV [Smithella sp.]HQI71908.1 DNA polymerase IV [Smithella sp.]
MSQQLFSFSSWPRAIVHIDGDAFFTSCEEAIHPELRGKPLITGGERGIVACASYPAKKLGIKRGVPLHEARKICPGLIVLPSDYETYSLFSRRMFDIMRRFTPDVEEYSIDEAFADITGMRRALHSSYEEIVLKMKKEIERELGITVSVGLSITKVLAKVASKHQKPSGVTIIKGRDIASYLGNLPVEKIWGIGNATTNYLAKMGIRYALEFAQLPEEKIRKKFTKPSWEIWQELRGVSVYPVTAEEKSSYASISKTKTFAPPTSNAEYLFAHLMRNMESACIKARRYSLAPKKIIVFLKKNDFNTVGSEAKLSRPCAFPMEFSGVIRELFDSCYSPQDIYRATGVILCDLEPDDQVQYSLFDNPAQAEKIREIYNAADKLAQKFGKHTLHLGSSHLIDKLGKGRRGNPTVREQTELYGETSRRHLGLPLLHIKT